MSKISIALMLKFSTSSQKEERKEKKNSSLNRLNNLKLSCNSYQLDIELLYIQNVQYSKLFKVDCLL